LNKPVRTTTPNGEEIVIMSTADYDRLVELEEDARDVAISEKALADYRAGRSETFTSEEINEYLAARNLVAFWRKRRGLTQGALAKAVGISQGFVAQIEGGKRVGDIRLHRRLAKALGVSVDELLSEDQEELVGTPSVTKKHAAKR
jgi:DNA-binding XRE family transcriptional regulator/PHD/YefM family antitoxin component YafN of YafNO toxin-antitoxin module